MFEIGSIKESFPSETEFRKFLRKVITIHLPRAEWNKENVMKAIRGCREAHGIPQFVTGYAGEDFVVGGKRATMFKCWGGRDTGSILFTDVPVEEHERLKMRSGDWHFLTVKFSPEEYEKLKKYPVEL